MLEDAEADRSVDRHPLSVLLSAYAVSPIRGGEPGSSWRLAIGLAGRGHTVHLLTSNQFSEEWPSLEQIPPNLHVTPVDRGLPWPLTFGHVGVYGSFLAWQRRSLDEARTIARAHHVDVVHHASWASLAWGSPLWRLSRPTLFGPVAGGSVTPQQLAGALRARDRVLERVRGSAVRASRFNHLWRSTARHSHVIPWNSDTRRVLGTSAAVQALVPWDTTRPELLSTAPRSIEQRDRTRLVWVGRLLPRKGVLIALDVIRELPDDFQLTIVGDGPEIDRARNHAHALAVHHRVDFVGKVETSRVVEELDRAAVMLFTSTRDTFGSQLLEASARGTPVAGILHQGFADFVPPEAGVSVPLAQRHEVAQQLAKGIRELVCDDAQWKRASGAARHFAEQHLPERQLGQFIEIYRSISGVGARASLNKGVAGVDRPLPPAAP